MSDLTNAMRETADNLIDLNHANQADDRTVAAEAYLRTAAHRIDELEKILATELQRKRHSD